MGQECRRKGKEKGMNAQLWGSFFWLAFGLVSIYGSLVLGLGSLREPGSGFLSFLAGCFICFMAVLVLMESFLRKKEARARLSSLWAGVNWRRPLIISFLVLGFILFLERLGFFLSSFLLIFILLKTVEKFSWSKAVLIPVLTLGCTYLLFDVFLKGTLPKGFLGF
jgi:putative tricarboxylic transport membrane protein